MVWIRAILDRAILVRAILTLPGSCIACGALLITYTTPFGIQFCLAYQAIKQLRIVEALKKKGVHCPELCQFVMNTVFKVKTILKLSQVVVQRKMLESVTKQLDHDSV